MELYWTVSEYECKVNAGASAAIMNDAIRDYGPIGPTGTALEISHSIDLRHCATDDVINYT
jgi:hypothetical protein